MGHHARLRSNLFGDIIKPPWVTKHEREAVEESQGLLAMLSPRLAARQDFRAADLAYADRRLLELARALASRPDLLMLDEPTAGMNPTEAIPFMDQIRQAPRTGKHNSPDRAQPQRCHGRIAANHGAGLRGQDRRGHARRGPAKRAGDRGLSRQKGGDGMRRYGTPPRKRDQAGGWEGAARWLIRRAGTSEVEGCGWGRGPWFRAHAH